MQRAADIRAAALGLTNEEKLELATELLDSVEGQPDAEWERAWVEEIERRVSAARSGTPGALWEEVRARLLSRFAR